MKRKKKKMHVRKRMVLANAMQERVYITTSGEMDKEIDNQLPGKEEMSPR